MPPLNAAAATIGEVAALFEVGPTFVKKMLRQYKETGDLNPLPHGGGHIPRLSAKHLKRLQTHVERNQDVTLEDEREAEALGGQRRCGVRRKPWGDAQRRSDCVKSQEVD